MSMSKWRDAGELARINSVPMGLEVPELVIEPVDTQRPGKVMMKYMTAQTVKISTGR